MGCSLFAPLTLGGVKVGIRGLGTYLAYAQEQNAIIGPATTLDSYCLSFIPLFGLYRSGQPSLFPPLVLPRVHGATRHANACKERHVGSFSLS